MSSEFSVPVPPRFRSGKTPSSHLIIVMMMASGVAHAAAQWSSDPGSNLAVAVRAGEQVLPKIATSPDDGCWISWFDSASGNYDVYLQKLTAAGDAQLAVGGLPISTHPQSSSLVDYDLAVDQTGNALVAFTDMRHGNLDVFAYRFSAAGQHLWGADGIMMSAIGNSNYEADPRIVQTSDGHFSIIWPKPSTPAPGLMLQRLDSAGNLLLTAGGVQIAGDGAAYPAFAEMVAADNGSIIVAYIRDIRTFSSPRHVHVQKFDALGQPQWNGGQPVILSTTAVPIAHRPRIAYDGVGGAVVTWHDTRLSNQFNVWAQRIDSAGNQLWTAGGVQASTLATQIHTDPHITFDPATGDTALFWIEKNLAQSAWGIYGQKLNAAGQRQWGDSGAVLMPVDAVFKLYVRAARDGDEHVVVTLEQPAATPQHRVLALGVTGAGTLRWSGAPVVLSSVASSKGRIPIAIDSQGVVKTVWEDARNGNSDLYAQNVNADGTLGSAAIACYANCDQSTAPPVLNVADFGCFLQKFAAHDPYANCDQSTTPPVLNVADFGCFLQRFAAGCR